MDKVREYQATIEKYKETEKRIEKLRLKFTNDYKIKQIIDLKLEEYVVGMGKKDTFCYRIETELDELGDIHGSPAIKFGVYFGIRGGDKKPKYHVSESKYGKSRYTIQITDSEGKNVLEKDIEPSHYMMLSGQTPPVVQQDEILSAINAYPTGSTNQQYSYSNPENAWSTAYFNHSDFKNVKQYNIAADFVLGSNGNYFPKIYIKSGETWKLLPSVDKVGFSPKDAANFPLVVDDKFIKALIPK